jgi:hypothetical protein
LVFAIDRHDFKSFKEWMQEMMKDLTGKDIPLALFLLPLADAGVG